MTDIVITIPLDEETARVYRAASTEDQRKIRLLLRLRLRELAELPSGSLRQLMDDIGAKAEARGLTPDILKALLRDA